MTTNVWHVMMVCNNMQCGVMTENKSETWYTVRHERHVAMHSILCFRSSFVSGKLNLQDVASSQGPCPRVLIWSGEQGQSLELLPTELQRAQKPCSMISWCVISHHGVKSKWRDSTLIFARRHKRIWASSPPARHSGVQSPRQAAPTPHGCAPKACASPMSCDERAASTLFWATPCLDLCVHHVRVRIRTSARRCERGVPQSVRCVFQVPFTWKLFTTHALCRTIQSITTRSEALCVLYLLQGEGSPKCWHMALNGQTCSFSST